MKKVVFLLAGILLGLLFANIDVSLAAAAGETSSGGSGYLAAYQETDPHPSQTSVWSTLAYLLSLLVVFAFVLFLAYMASRFLGSRFAAVTSSNKEGKVLETMSLGGNRSVCVVEVAGNILMLGVTENSVSLLKEITDPEEIEYLRQKAVAAGLREGEVPLFLSEQFESMDQISKRIGNLFHKKRK